MNGKRGVCPSNFLELIVDDMSQKSATTASPSPAIKKEEAPHKDAKDSPKETSTTTPPVAAPHAPSGATAEIKPDEKGDFLICETFAVFLCVTNVRTMFCIIFGSPVFRSIRI